MKFNICYRRNSVFRIEEISISIQSIALDWKTKLMTKIPAEHPYARKLNK